MVTKRKEAAVSNRNLSNFIHALIAVVAGNLVYLALLRYLPPSARHMPRHLDLGLLVDLWFCLVFFGIVKTFATRRASKS